MDNGVWYDYILTVETPDGISNVVNAMIAMQLWLSPTVVFDLTVNGKQCNTPQYEVHTTFAGAGEGTIYFDCSNIITKEGDYNVRIMPSKDTGASTFWVDLTYFNNPKATVEVHGTEYSPGDRGKVWLQLLNSTGEYITEGACYIDIYDPNNIEYLENAAMTNAQHDGLYFYDLIIPQQQGVYPAIGKCYYNTNQTNEHVDGFTLVDGIVEAGTYVDTWFLDGEEHKIKQLLGSIEFEYNVDDMCGVDTPEGLLTGLTLTVNAKWKDTVTNDNIVLSIYNYTSSSWIELPNQIIRPNDRVTVTNFISSNNYTRDGLVNGAGTLTMLFNDTLKGQGADKKIEVDWVQVSCEQLSGLEWQEVKGSSELHVTSDHYWVIDESSITGNVTNETYDGYMYFNFIVSSQTSVNETNQDVHITLPTPFPCHHVKNVTQDGVDINWTGHDSGTEACEVHWLMDLEQFTNYDMVIKTDNWWKVQIYSWKSQLDMVQQYIEPMCNFYQVENGYPPYTIPVTNKVNESFDAFYRTCSSTLDYYYHINQSIYNSYLFPNAILSFDQMKELDADWRYVSITKNQYLLQVNTILGVLGLSDDMAVTAIMSGQAPSFFEFWSNESTGWRNYNELNDITSGNVSVSVNTTEISDSVWGYSGNISSNLINQFVNSFWNYTGTISNTILNAIGLNIWSQANRTLTYTEDVTNYTLINEGIWSYGSRTVNATINNTAVSENVWSYNQGKYVNGIVI